MGGKSPKKREERKKKVDKKAVTPTTIVSKVVTPMPSLVKEDKPKL
jgi:hypothetical protein